MEFVPVDHCVQCGVARGNASTQCRAVGDDGVTVVASWSQHRWRDWSPGRFWKMGLRQDIAGDYGRLLYRDLVQLPCSFWRGGHQGGGPVCERCGLIIPERAVRTIALYQPGDGGTVVKAIVRKVDEGGVASLAVPISADQLRLLRGPIQYSPTISPGRWSFAPSDLQVVDRRASLVDD